MIRRAALMTLAVALAGGLMAASAGGATAAVSRTACARSAVVGIKSFTFYPASVRPGGSSTATLAAVNCTDLTQQTSEVWFGRFTLIGTGIPRGCPILDPLPLPARFPPHRTVSRHVTYLVPLSCTASRLIVTVDIDGHNGKVLAKGTAILRIIQGSAAASANPRR